MADWKQFGKRAGGIVLGFAWGIGTIAGFGNCVMVHEYVAAVAVVVNGVLAYPVARSIIRHVMED